MAVRIIVDLKRFVADERVMTYILIDSKYKTISEIEARISRLLGTSEPFCLCIGSVMLPPDETVQILYPEEIVTVVRLNPMSRNHMAPRQNYNMPMASLYHHMNYPQFSDDSGDDEDPRLNGPNIPIIAHENLPTTTYVACNPVPNRFAGGSNCADRRNQLKAATENGTHSNNKGKQ